ncbi:MAG: substrate-binding domain-containing protein [Burkholderiales bacterium]|nr:substrate-binding domain-containing protein [Burkholderiales bacterium]
MQTETLKVLSAGAVEPGLVAAARAYEQKGGLRVDIDWATTPTIRRRLEAGERADVLVVPAAAADDFIAAGRVDATTRLRIGAVGVGVAVRSGDAAPDIASPEAFVRALLAAESVIFTRATSGIYVESLLERLGLYAELLPRITRFTTGPEMIDHLIHSRGHVLCMGAIVELLMFVDKGIAYVGALPGPLQQRTAYDAVAMAAADPEHARAFLRHLDLPDSRVLFTACGVETT